MMMAGLGRLCSPRVALVALLAATGLVLTASLVRAPPPVPGVHVGAPAAPARHGGHAHAHAHDNHHHGHAYPHAPVAPAATLAPTVAGRAPLMYLTAVSSNHFRWFMRLLASVQAVDPRVPYRVVDLGLAPAERDWLAASAAVTVDTFDFSRYPPYFNVSVAAGEYAFKPVVIAETLERADVVVWMDASNLLKEPLSRHLEDVRRDGGFFSSVSSGTVRDWTHPGMLAYYGVGGGDSVLGKTNCNAAFLIFERAATLEALVKPWVACALTKACIAPEGSSRANHRQDQAALSLLVYRSNGRFNCDWTQYANWHTIHQEGDHLPDPRTERGIGVPATLASLARFRDRVGARIAAAPAARLAWETLLQATTVALELGGGEGVELTVWDVIGNLYAQLPAEPAAHVLLLSADAGEGSSVLTDALCARLLLSMLGTRSVLLTAGTRPVNDLETVAPTLRELGWEPTSTMDAVVAQLGDLTALAQPGPHVDVLWARERLNPKTPTDGPALLHITAPSLAAWDARVALGQRLRQVPGVTVLLTVGDRDATPWIHLDELVAHGWASGRETLLLWLSTASSPSHRGGCRGRWGVEGLTEFKRKASAAGLAPASYDLVGAGCLLAAVTSAVSRPADYQWRATS
jgi:hypothetical protein